MVPLSSNPLKSAQRWATVIGVVLTFSLILFIGLWVWGMQRKVESLTQENIALSADGKAADTWHTERVIIETKQEKAREETRQVLERNREWADEPMPDDVAERLRKRPDSE